MTEYTVVAPDERTDPAPIQPHRSDTLNHVRDICLVATCLGLAATTTLLFLTLHGQPVTLNIKLGHPNPSTTRPNSLQQPNEAAVETQNPSQSNTRPRASLSAPTPLATPGAVAKKQKQWWQMSPKDVTSGPPVVYEGIEFWDGSIDTLPKPMPLEWPDDLREEAKGKRAYVTMVSRGTDLNYVCLATALVSSIKATNPDPSIDIVAAVLVLKSSKFHGKSNGATAQDVLGKEAKQLLESAGVTRFVLWDEMNTRGMELTGYWRQAFSKLKMWTLTDYERVLFLDSDILVFKNLDHLFKEPEFTTATTWDCANYNSPKKPSGGFLVIQPSMKTFGLIEAYLKGVDPCFHRWRLGDMKLLWTLFIDLNVLKADSKSQWPTHDGDYFKEGRCYQGGSGMWPNRIDANKGPSPLGRWRALNETYDLIANVCDEIGFQKTGDRFNRANGGDKGWARHDAFSVHLTCGDKPKCHRNKEKEKRMPPCLRDVWDRWYEALYRHYDPKKRY